MAWDCEEPLAERRTEIHAEYQRDFIEFNEGLLIAALERREELLADAGSR